MNKIGIITLFAASSCWLFAQDETGPHVENFETFEAGAEPDLFILDGTFTVENGDAGKVLQLGPEPLVEGSIQLGKSLKTSSEVSARIQATNKRRSYPRFGVGLHGMSGYKLRVVPAKKEIELVRNEEPVASAPFDWEPGKWYFVRLRVAGSAEAGWKVEGWAWTDGAEAPETPQISFDGEPARLQGKGSIVGTPYSGLPILFDDVEIKALP